MLQLKDQPYCPYDTDNRLEAAWRLGGHSSEWLPAAANKQSTVALVCESAGFGDGALVVNFPELVARVFSRHGESRMEKGGTRHQSTHGHMHNSYHSDTKARGEKKHDEDDTHYYSRLAS